jgi:hypothetical protein
MAAFLLTSWLTLALIYIMRTFLLHSYLPSCSHDDDGFLASSMFAILLPWWQLSCLMNVCRHNPMMAAFLLSSWLTACSYNDSFLASIISAVLLPWWELSCLMNVCRHSPMMAAFSVHVWQLAPVMTAFLLQSYFPSCSHDDSFLAS